LVEPLLLEDLDYRQNHVRRRARCRSGDLADAEAYFAFAAIEDLIWVDGVIEQLNSPASQTLQLQYGRGREYFEDLARRLEVVGSSRRTEDTLKLENPELLFIEPDRTATIDVSPPENDL
jgi:hypothetical protein